MRNLEEFENRNSDWLAKERAYEKHKNPWNLDEARIIKEEHEKNHRENEQRLKDDSNSNINVRNGENYSQPVTFFKVIKFIVLLFLCMWFIPFIISLLLFFLPIINLN